MSIHRKNYISKDGERFGLLVDHNGIPDFWTTLYLTTNVRHEKHSTQKAFLNHLTHLYIWEVTMGERIFERILNFPYKSDISSTAQFFTDVEIQKLADHSKLMTKEARKKLQDKYSKKRDDSNLKVLFPTYKLQYPVVGKAQFSNRITVYAEYFEFVAKNILRERSSFSTYLGIIENTKNAILRKKTKYMRNCNNTNDPNRKAPPPEVFQYLMEIIEPSNVHNPYTISVRQRNYLLFKILYDTGLRAGELLQLKVSDINFAQSEIMVRARHDDPEDTFRTDEPNAKTLERDIPISETLRDQIREYVLNERRFISNTQKHSFLFVSYKGLTKGQPLSSIQFSRIVEKISVNEELAQFIKSNGIVVGRRVTRHGFRHNLNNKLSKAIDQNNKDAINEGRMHDVISEKKEIEQRMYINGHKSEKAAEVYNLRHTKEQAEKLLKMELEKIVPRFTKSGYEFYLNNDVWVLDQNRTINWKLVNNSINPLVYEGFKLSIARLAEEVSSHHTFNCFMYFKQYLISSEIYQGGIITSELILALKTNLTKDNEYKLGTIRALLRCWIEWKNKGLEQNLEDTLDRLVLSGNVKGKAVLHHCPYTGPYSLTEQQSLLVWAGNAFQKEILTLEEFGWFYLIYATARRPSQIRALRLCDLSIQINYNEIIYEINIPRAKQRNGCFREEFRSLQITEDVYLVLKNLTEIVRKKAQEHLTELKESELVQLPIFINFTRFYECKNIHEFKTILNQTPDFFHLSSAEANYMSRVISRKCEAVSERTGDYLHFTPVRCRRTRATNLSRHGITGVQMAYLLDHSDTQQLKVYTAHTGELALRIFDKMNDAMTLLATQFEGRIIKSESEALRASDLNSRVFKSSGNQLGNCGGSPSCQAGMKACLLCNQFQPLVYAPWDELFLEFVEELEQRRLEGASELVLKSYDLQLAHIKAIMNACDKYIQVESIA